MGPENFNPEDFDFYLNGQKIDPKSFDKPLPLIINMKGTSKRLYFRLLAMVIKRGVLNG